MDEGQPDEPSELSTRLVAYYREVVATHTDDPVIGLCLVCKVSRCQDWRFAWERLTCAGAVEAAERPPDLVKSTTDGEP